MNQTNIPEISIYPSAVNNTILKIINRILLNPSFDCSPLKELVEIILRNRENFKVDNTNDELFSKLEKLLRTIKLKDKYSDQEN